MDWKKVIKDLTDAGMTQGQIAEQCGVAQSTVSEIARGVIKQPSFTFGTRLAELHKAKSPPAEQPAAQPSAGRFLVDPHAGDQSVRNLRTELRRQHRDGPASQRERRHAR